jgi:hypothetical protein
MEKYLEDAALDSEMPPTPKFEREIEGVFVGL